MARSPLYGCLDIWTDLSKTTGLYEMLVNGDMPPVCGDCQKIVVVTRDALALVGTHRIPFLSMFAPFLEIILSLS